MIMYAGTDRKTSLSLMTIVSLLICCEQCGIEICFSWKVSLSSLTLICRVNSLNHRIIIDNQFGREVADCISDLCHSYHQNASIIQLLKTNETIYSVNGHIDYKVNGNWTCRHGSNLDIAKVDVTVLKGEQKIGDQVINDKEECRKKPGTCKNGKSCCCRNTRKKILTRIGDKRALVGIFLVLPFLFGIPVIVSVLEKESRSITAIPAMVVMGMTFGSTTGILIFRRKTNMLPTSQPLVQHVELQ